MKKISRSLRTTSVLLLLGLTGALAPNATATSYDGQLIRAVEYEGLRGVPAETLDFYLFGGRFEPGLRLDLEDLDRRLKALWKRGLVDDVRIEARPADGGVVLVVRIVERSVLASIDYVGLGKMSRSEIVEQIDRERIAVLESQPLDRGELRRLEAAIEELYKEKGFRFADASFTLEEMAPGQTRVTFTVDEGGKVRIGDIRFDGNTVYGDWRLRRAMKKTKKSGLASRFTQKDLYNPAHLEEDLEGVRSLYRKAGYKDVLVARAELDVEARRPGAPSVEDQKRRLVVTVPVEEGERWKLREIRLEGNEVLGEAVLRRQFEAPRGGWLRSKVIDDAFEKIDRLYKSLGYVFARVDTEVEEVGDAVADIVVRIEEHDQFRVGRVEFDGNTKTRDKVLRRQMLVQESSVMNMTAVERSLLRIRQMGYFTVDEEEPVRFDFDAEEAEVDLQVRGEEADRTELRFGGGWSEPDGVFGHFGIRTTNFRGRGETLGISLQAGQNRNIYDLEYGVPWFLDRPQNVSFRLFRQDQQTRVTDDVVFESGRAGASLTYGRSFRAFQAFSLAYVFSDVDEVNLLSVDEADDTADGVADGIVSQEVDFRISSIVPSWTYNTLDSRFEPTRGLRATASLEIAGGPLGGDSSYLRPQAGLTWFRPVSRRPVRSSFAVQVKAGWIAPFDSTELFASQLFRLGGESSVRGFRSGTITVREAGTVQLFDADGNPVMDDDGDNVFEERPLRFDEIGFPLGGEKKFQLNLEYHLMPEGPFRVVLFGDAGGVFAADQSFGTELLRYSAGAELRLAVPLFPAPLRLIFARSLDPLDGDRFESVGFSLSASF